jgi:hypothetical protein
MRTLWDRWNSRRRLLQEAVAVALAGGGSAAQALDVSNSLSVPLGSRKVRLGVRRFGQGGLRYLSLHENEHTAVVAAAAVLGRRAGTLIELQCSGQRLVGFREGARLVAFDPNRIFSDAGAERSLRRHGTYTTGGMVAARALREAVLSLLVGRPDDPVVALHNNAGSTYTVDAYRPGGLYAGDVKSLAIQPDRPRDAFFLVTRQSLFDALRHGGFNVVLQSDDPVDDGSLSVWFQQQRRAYINVEARFGALREQQRMIEAVAALAPG